MVALIEWRYTWRRRVQFAELPAPSQKEITMAEKVIIKEVAARDGLQAQPKHLTVEQRIALLGALASAPNSAIRCSTVRCLGCAWSPSRAATSLIITFSAMVISFCEGAGSSANCTRRRQV